MLKYAFVIFIAASACVTRAARNSAIYEQANQGKFPASCDDGEQCHQLGLLAEQQESIELEHGYFEKGCGFEHDQSCVELARIKYLIGQLGQAKALLNTACDKKKNGFGCLHLAVIEEQLGNSDKAQVYAKKACQLKEGLGCELVLNYLDETAVEERFSYLNKARNLFNEKCSLGDDASCNMLLQLTSIEAMERLNGTLQHLKRNCSKAQESEFCAELSLLEFLQLTCKRQPEESTECSILLEQSEKLFRKYFRSKPI